MLWVQSGEYSRIIKRCSSWLENKIDRLALITDKAVDRHEKTKSAADSAMRKLEDTKRDVQNTEYDEKQRIKAAWIKGQEGINHIRIQMSEGDIKKKKVNVDQAIKDMNEARVKEKALRMLYNLSAGQEEIEKHTLSVIGDLPIIKVNK